MDCQIVRVPWHALVVTSSDLTLVTPGLLNTRRRKRGDWDAITTMLASGKKELTILVNGASVFGNSAAQ